MKKDWLDKVSIGITGGFIALLIIAIVSVVTAIPTYYLWNWLLPEIFGVAKITIFQAWGLNVLAGILFKNLTTKNNNETKKEE